MSTAGTRRRGVALENAILDAAWEELAEKGWLGFTIDGVSTRAGTAKAVLYRRWRNRVELAEDLLQRETESRQWPREDSIDLVTDLRGFLVEMAEFLSSPLGSAAWGVMTQGDPARRPSVLEGPVIVGRVRTIFENALGRGELIREPSSAVLNLGHAVVMSEFLHTGHPPTRAGIEIVLDQVWMPAIRSAQAAP